MSILRLHIDLDKLDDETSLKFTPVGNIGANFLSSSFLKQIYENLNIELGCPTTPNGGRLKYFFFWRAIPLRSLYSVAWRPLTRDIQIMWLVKKMEMVQVYCTLDLEYFRDHTNLNGWEIYMTSYIAPSG